MLPKNDEERKAIDLTAQWKLFPLATIALAKHIKFGADKYCDGEIRWDRTKSPDEIGSLSRHAFEHVVDGTDPIAILWRAFALCEKFFEEQQDPILKTYRQDQNSQTKLPADLEEFLRSEGALDEYLKYRECNLAITPKCHLIDEAFIWENADRGEDYWLEIDKKWLAYLKEQGEL